MGAPDLSSPRRSQTLPQRPSTSEGIHRTRAFSVTEHPSNLPGNQIREQAFRPPPRTSTFRSVASGRSAGQYDKYGRPGESLLQPQPITGNRLVKFFLDLVAPQFETRKDLTDPWTTYLRRFNYALIWVGFGLTLVTDLDILVQHTFIAVITIESALRLGIKRRVDLLYVIDIVPPIIYYITWGVNPDLLEDAFQSIVLRAIRFLKYSILYPSIKKSLSSCNSVAIMVLISIFFLGTLAYLAERGDYDADSGRFFTDGVPSTIDSMLVAIYWAFVTASTIGYGDIVPSTWPGRLIAAATVYLGIVIISVPGILVGRHFVHLYKQQQEETVKAITEHICRQTPQIVREKNAPQLLHHIKELNEAIEQHKQALSMVEEAVQQQRQKDRVDTSHISVRTRPSNVKTKQGPAKVRTW